MTSTRQSPWVTGSRCSTWAACWSSTPRPIELLANPANDFVASFLGAERSLKRLAWPRWADLTSTPGPVIAITASAAEAREAAGRAGHRVAGPARWRRIRRLGRRRSTSRRSPTLAGSASPHAVGGGARQHPAPSPRGDPQRPLRGGDRLEDDHRYLGAVTVRASAGAGVTRPRPAGDRSRSTEGHRRLAGSVRGVAVVAVVAFAAWAKERIDGLDTATQATNPIIRWECLFERARTPGELCERTVEHLKLTVIPMAFGIVIASVLTLIACGLRWTLTPITVFAASSTPSPASPCSGSCVTYTTNFGPRVIALTSYTLLILVRNSWPGSTRCRVGARRRRRVGDDPTPPPAHRRAPAGPPGDLHRHPGGHGDHGGPGGRLLDHPARRARGAHLRRLPAASTRP